MSFSPALVAVSTRGRRLAELLPGTLIPGRPAEALGQAWRSHRHIVFFGAAGIAVRLVAPLLTSKRDDPALVVVDDAALHAISLVAGHEGGANDLAAWVAEQLGAEAVISTATDILPIGRLTVGIGCSRGAQAIEIEELVRTSLAQIDHSMADVACAASFQGKHDEPGILQFAERWKLPLRFYDAQQLRAIEVPQPSSVVEAAVGTPSVAEAAALLAAGELSARAPLLRAEKRKSARVTVAIAEAMPPGRLNLVGLGPGGRAQLTDEAWNALREADTVVGYDLYTRTVLEWLPRKTISSWQLGQEDDRVRAAVEMAGAGQNVALVCSGDAGIYGLAGLVYEQLFATESPSLPPTDVRVIPGITAANSAAALLGAPLMADYVTISLSDLHVPTELIRTRLQAAAFADLVVVLYNPASARRRTLVHEAVTLMRDHRAASTPVGLVRNAYRPDQKVRIVTLSSLQEEDVDMFTTVVIGNSQTVYESGRMVTRRRYSPSSV
ncbi:MAG: precorrin-3B C(17)-methyltransferase [Chloroflexi bacterium]|nr:precorrin-3B C(17)-methyltransferase [Chloroflexota bacterium]